MSITIKALPEAERGQCPVEYSFGTGFSDHMFTQVYDAGQGWHDAEIRPFGNLSLNPAAAVLHYSQEIFEGLKAYRDMLKEIRDNVAALIEEGMSLEAIIEAKPGAKYDEELGGRFINPATLVTLMHRSLTQPTHEHHEH